MSESTPEPVDILDFLIPVDELECVADWQCLTARREQELVLKLAAAGDREDALEAEIACLEQSAEGAYHEIQALRATLTAVLATVINHSPAHPGQHPTQDFCSYCFEGWPCHSAEVYESATALLNRETS